MSNPTGEALLAGHGLISDEYLKEFQRIKNQEAEDRLAKIERRKPRVIE